MANTIYTNDGKMHVILSDDDQVELIREYVCNEMANTVNDLFAENTYEKAFANANYESIEFELESANAVIEDINTVILNASENLIKISKQLFNIEKFSVKERYEIAQKIENIAKNIIEDI